MKVKNQGMSLVEVMLAASLIGGLGLVLMNLNKQTVKSSTKYQFDTEMNLTTNEILALLSDPAKCLNTFKTNATPTNIDSKYYISSDPLAPANGYGNAGIYITSYKLTTTANDGTLTILFQNKNILKGSTGPATTPRTIKLYVVGTPGAVTNCRSLSTSTTEIWSHGAGPDIFYSGGRVGIGMAAPVQQFDVNGGSAMRGTVFIGDGLASNIRKITPSTALNFSRSDGSIEAVLDGVGNFGVGLSNPGPTFKLDVNGTAHASTAFDSPAFLYTSDARLKTNIREIPNALDRAKKLRGVVYEWKDKKNGANSGDQIGLIAQEVEKVFPEAVVTNSTTGMKSVEYGNLIAPMIEALKAQQAIIQKQQQEIDAIKKQLSKKRK